MYHKASNKNHSANWHTANHPIRTRTHLQAHRPWSSFKENSKCSFDFSANQSTLLGSSAISRRWRRPICLFCMILHESSYEEWSLPKLTLSNPLFSPNSSYDRQYKQILILAHCLASISTACLNFPGKNLILCNFKLSAEQKRKRVILSNSCCWWTSSFAARSYREV